MEEKKYIYIYTRKDQVMIKLKKMKTNTKSTLKKMYKENKDGKERRTRKI